MFQRIVESDLDEARKFLLVNVIETYFELTGEDVERFQRLLSDEGLREASVPSRK